MPYDADLRCSYCCFSLNMSWFYEAMSEMGEEFDFKSENEYKRPKVIKAFENHIEKEAKKYMEAHIFNKEALTKDMEMSESIWGYLREVALEYSNEHPEVEMKMVDSDGETIKPSD